MPKRVIDFDAMWASDKLASCAEWAQVEYAWLYGLADASGSFEMTNLRVIWGRVAAIRNSFTMERLEAVLAEFIARGLLFSWMENGKRYGHWTGSDVPGRLPPPSWRARLERLAPAVPRAEHDAYVSRFSSRNRDAANRDSDAERPVKFCADARPADSPDSARLLAKTANGDCKDVLEAPQGQEWGLGLDLKSDLNSEWNKEGASQTRAAAQDGSDEAPNKVSSTSVDSFDKQRSGEPIADMLVQIFEEERGLLPPAEPLTPQLRRQCRQRISAGFTAEEFRAAVRRAAATPFLSGNGERGWQATFDWFVANDTNVRKVLDGRYQPAGARKTVPQASPCAAPVAAAFGARVSTAALERIRAREAAAGAVRAGTFDFANDSSGDSSCRGTTARAAPVRSNGDCWQEHTKEKGVA